MTTLSQAIRWKRPFKEVYYSAKEDLKHHGIIGAFKKRRAQESEEEKGLIGLGKSIVHRGKEVIGLKQATGVVAKTKEKVRKVLYGQHSPDVSSYQLKRVLPQLERVLPQEQEIHEQRVVLRP